MLKLNNELKEIKTILKAYSVPFSIILETILMFTFNVLFGVHVSWSEVADLLIYFN